MASVLPARSSGESMPSATTSEAPPEVVPATILSRLVVLAKPLMAGLGPMKVASMEPAEHRLDGLGAGVEGGQLELGAAEGVLEDALLDPDDRRGVGDVGEVAEPQRCRWARRRPPSPRRSRCPRLIAVAAVVVVPAGGGQQSEGHEEGQPTHRARPAPGVCVKSDGHSRVFYMSGAHPASGWPVGRRVRQDPHDPKRAIMRPWHPAATDAPTSDRARSRSNGRWRCCNASSGRTAASG